jgi:hypothetical protein
LWASIVATTVVAVGPVPVAALGVDGGHDTAHTSTVRAVVPTPSEVQEALRSARARGHVPAVAGSITGDRGSPSVATVGVRRLGRSAHRAGVAKFTLARDFEALPDWQGTAEQRRAAFTRWLLRRPPTTPVGRFSYSNAGYTIAARMATEVSGRTWRRLVRDEVFGPLGVSAWFGWPADRPGQPWGHWLVRGRLHPAPPDAYRLPDLVAPAADIAVHPPGYVRFLQLHLRGLRGHGTRLLRASTIRFMHRPVGGYAMGWVRRRINGVMTSLHDGTAGTFSALAAIQPDRRLAAATFANAGGKRGDTAVGVGLGQLLAEPVRSGPSGNDHEHAQHRGGRDDQQHTRRWSPQPRGPQESQSRTSAPRSANTLKSSRYLRDCLGNDPLNSSPTTFMKPRNSTTLRETQCVVTGVGSENQFSTTLCTPLAS